MQSPSVDTSIRKLKERSSAGADRKRLRLSSACLSSFNFPTSTVMQGNGHPLQGVGYGDRPTPFDQLSRVAMAHGQQQQHQLPIASTSSTSISNGQGRRRPASSNGDFGPSPPEYTGGRPNKKSRKSSSGPGGNGEGDPTGDGQVQPKKKSKQVLSCSECKVSTTDLDLSGSRFD